MKCICKITCQTRDDTGYIRTFEAGQVFDFKKCPTHFKVLEGPIDFNTAKEEELLEAEYKLQDLKDFILKKYKRKAGSRQKEATVALLLDSRYREVDVRATPTVI